MKTTTTKKTTKAPAKTIRCPPFAKALKSFVPPELLNVSEWAEKYRVLPGETAAEPGPWRTSRTPYLLQPMLDFTDPKVHRIVVVAASQVGKSELELNILGYIMSLAPGSVLYIQPYKEDAKRFSRQRIKPMIKNCPLLSGHITDTKGKNKTKGRAATDTILQKTFPGGSLTMCGSASAADLCSLPAKYLIADERDRWEDAAGTEGDPWELAQARQTTFYNRKAVEVSTPTIEGSSKIAASYELGTQARWQHQCPKCGQWAEITKELIDHNCEKIRNKGKVFNKITIHGFRCPYCNKLTPEDEMRRAPQRWHEENPAAYEAGIKSYWLTAFASPWQPWATIFQKLYDNLDRPENLKVVYNTMLGRLWKEKHVDVNADEYLERLEDYGAELPDGVIALTCGVDTQDDRLEYEVVGWGASNESWGIRRGFIAGAPDMPSTWAQLDEVLNKTYRYADGYGLGISCTFIDSGGHYTNEVYKQTKLRNSARVFAIKGRGGEGVPLLNPPKQVETKDGAKVWLYTLGVDAGKAAVMNMLTVEKPGAKYCHFSADLAAGYNETFFKGLFSEKLVRKKTASGYKWAWEKLPGHERNEPLDCRNYAYAARASLVNDFDKLGETIAERRQAFKCKAPEEAQKLTTAPPRPVRRRRSSGPAANYDI